MHKTRVSYQGIFLAIAAMLFFSITYAFYKGCDPYLPNTHTIFLQNLMSWILILPMALKKGGHFLHSPQLKKILARTLFGLFSMYCITRALHTVSLAEVITLNNTAPLFVPLILWAWHKTKMHSRLVVGILIGFLGVWIMLRPDFSQMQEGLILAFISGIFTALLIIATRQIAHEPFMRILFYYFLLFWVALSPFVLTHWVSFPALIWLYIFLAAVSMILAQICFTYALRHSTAHEVAPFVYTSVIFAAFIDWGFWHDVPSLLSAVGMLIVCVGGWITIKRET